MNSTAPHDTSPLLLNLWVFTAEGLLITHFSNEKIQELADADMMAGLLLALTDLAGQLRGSNIQGVILEDRHLYYKRQGDLFAVGETSLDFSKTKELTESLLFVLNRFSQTQRDMPGFVQLNDFSATRSEIESYLVFNGLLERKKVFEQYANEEIIDNIGIVTSQYLSPDGKLITGSTDRFLKIWNLARKEEGVFFAEGHTSTINAIISSGNHIISFSETGEIFIWDQTSWQLFDSFSIDCVIKDAIVDPTNKDRVLIIKPDGVSLLLIRNQTIISPDYNKDLSPLVYSSFIFEGEQILSIHSDGSVFGYGALSMDIQSSSKIRLDAGEAINSVSFFPQEGVFIITTQEGNLIRFDPSRITSDKVPLVLEDGKISFSAFDSQLDALMLGFRNGLARIILPFSKGTKAFQIKFQAHNDPISFIAYLARQDILITCSESRDIRIWREIQIKDAAKILQAGKDRLENVYNNLKSINEWLEKCTPVETETLAKQMLMKARLYRSRIDSYQNVLRLGQPWWLNFTLEKELKEAKELLEKVNGLLTSFEKEITPQLLQMVNEEDEEEEKISLDSILQR
ncbi:MAG: WD40 repeat domain-containing protein [Candidatus Hodarchaeota archaeon]